MRIITIAAVLLLAIAMFMLFGTGCNTPGSAGSTAAGAESAAAGGVASGVPSDGEIIAAIKARWTANDSEELAALKDKLQTVLRQQQGCSDRAKLECAFFPDEAAFSRLPTRVTFQGPGWYDILRSPYRHDTQDACVEDSIGKICNTDDSAKDIKSQIADFKFQANENVVTVEKTNNYEGNIISYVDVRAKGTDHLEPCKVTMKVQNNILSVVNMECPPPQ